MGKHTLKRRNPTVGGARWWLCERQVNEGGACGGPGEASAWGESPLQSSCAPSQTPPKKNSPRSLPSVGNRGLCRRCLPCTGSPGGERCANPAAASKVSHWRTSNAGCVGREWTFDTRSGCAIFVRREGEDRHDGESAVRSAAESGDDLCVDRGAARESEQHNCNVSGDSVVDGASDRGAAGSHDQRPF